MPVSNLMGIMDLPIINKKYNLKPEQITYLGPRSVDKEEIGTYLRMVNPSTDEIHFEGVPNYERGRSRPLRIARFRD